jgi:intracellular multiplication protein IcmP
MPDPSQDTAGSMWMLIALFLALAFIWYFGHTHIVSGFFVLKHWEIQFLDFFGGWFTNLKGMDVFVTQTRPGDATFSATLHVANQVGRYLRFFCIVLLLLMSAAVYSKSLRNKFKQQYTINTLLQSESETWPYSKFALRIDLLKEDIEKGPWAMAMQPMQFAKQYHLIREIPLKPAAEQTSLRPEIKVVLLRSKASRVFSMQLGKLWKGIDDLNEHTKALYAVFAAKSSRDSKRATELLKQFAFTAGEGRVDYSGVDEVLAKYKDFPPVVEITQKHAYVLTVMASMLQLARTDGVLSSAEFLWIKPIDRSLWFMLNTIGRQTAPSEVGGPYAHWLAEKEMGRKLRTPMVDQAVEALEKGLEEVKYVAG